MKAGIVVASFGTSHKDTRQRCIESIEKDVAREFSDYPIRRAFTSRKIINILKNRDEIYIENEREAIEALKKEDVETIYVQPSHIIPGIEYEKLIKLKDVVVSTPLLFEERDYDEVVEKLPLNLKEEEALVFMGHGSEHSADENYTALENTYRKKGMENVFIGTVEGSRGIAEIISELEKGNYKKIVLQPFMLVAGDHAKNDMAGEDEDSWENTLIREGFQVETRLIGLGEFKAIRNIFIRHLQETIEEERV